MSPVARTLRNMARTATRQQLRTIGHCTECKVRLTPEDRRKTYCNACADKAEACQAVGRARKRARGICRNCTTEVGPGKTTCPACLAVDAVIRRTNYKKNKALGVCRDCGSDDLPEVKKGRAPGGARRRRVLCARCTERRVKAAEARRERQIQAAEAQGTARGTLCKRCWRRPHREGRNLCGHCAGLCAARNKAYYNRVKAGGLCYRCNRETPPPGRKSCSTCCAKLKEARST